MFERKATKKELVQLRVEQSNSEVTKLRAENSTLRAEFAALKDGKQPKVADSMPEIVSRENYYRMTFRDENGEIKTQVEVTPDRVIATANKITLNGADVSNTQI